ncbi:MAG TPA: M28 family peptidase [Longimicrobium sp.]|nr:M28 family peptidase [Longimicrobium sp.]
MKRSRNLLALVLVAAAASPALAQAPRPAGEGPLRHAPRPTAAAITPADAMTRVYALADDSMMGREVGTRGGVKTAEHLAREARRLGLEPAGEGGTFFQTVPLEERALDPASTLSVDGAALALNTDFLPVPTVEGVFTFADRMRPQAAPVVFGGVLGGPMISAEAAQGKFVLFTAPTYRFWSAGALDRYAGAAGIAVAVLDATPPDIVSYFTADQMSLVETGKPAPAVPALVIVTTGAAQRMMGRALAGLTVGATGKTVTGDAGFRLTQPAFPAQNVIAVLRGSDPVLRNEYVALGSHADHDGFAEKAVDHDSLRVFNRVLRPEGADEAAAPATPQANARIAAMLDSLRKVRAARVDSVYNGADDDASGVAAMLEIAEYLAANRPKRSVLFVWHTAEEKGLLGSEHFGEHPTVPRESIVAQLNIDMIGRGAVGDLPGGGPGYLQLIGSRRLSTQLGDLIEEINRAAGHGFTFDYTYDADGHPDNIYCRSDHYNYARWGIPVTFFTTGGHSEYHMVTDEPQYIDYEKLAKVTRLIADVTKSIGDRPARLVVDKPKPDPYGECQQ